MNRKKLVSRISFIIISLLALFAAVQASTSKALPEPAASAEQPLSSPEVSAEQPADFCCALSAIGMEPADISDCKQLIIVEAVGNTATLQLWEQEDEVWQSIGSGLPGYVGRNGVSASKREGDGCTPQGFFPLGTAFGLGEVPVTSMPYRPITENSYWVDDPESALYNQWVEASSGQDWHSAEHLMDYPAQYELAVVIAYNTDPILSGGGSAIFLHCGSKSTAGCVATSRENMIWLLSQLDPALNPAILITG